MIYTPVIHVFTWFATHLLMLSRWSSLALCSCVCCSSVADQTLWNECTISLNVCGLLCRLKLPRKIVVQCVCVCVFARMETECHFEYDLQTVPTTCLRILLQTWNNLSLVLLSSSKYKCVSDRTIIRRKDVLAFIQMSKTWLVTFNGIRKQIC